MPLALFQSTDPALISAAMSFLFVFAVVFALLAYTKLFVQKRDGEPVGKEPRAVYAAIALVFGAAAASYEPMAAFLQQVIPPATVFFIAVFFLVFLKQLFAGKKEKGDPMQTLAVLAIFLIVLGAFWDDVAGLAGVSLFISPENLFVLIAIIVILAIFYVASQAKEEEGKKIKAPAVSGPVGS